MITDKQYIEAAKLQYESDGEIEFDDEPEISRGGSDPGVYVQAWLWVDDSQVEEESDD